ncbi:hypothetical protein SBV1_1890054 [Verrucomicrobia bacterium]|nr:hypothetical protein SBV1_1890054 [Verrucomicrobiota bacterium]
MRAECIALFQAISFLALKKVPGNGNSGGVARGLKKHLLPDGKIQNRVAAGRWHRRGRA